MKLYLKHILIALIVVLAAGQPLSAQTSKNNKLVETSFAVKGNCGMCKRRIEDAALRTKGVKMAEWNKANQQLTVLFRSDKTTENDIVAAVAHSGHKAADQTVDQERYKALPECCQYDDVEGCAHSKKKEAPQLNTPTN